MKARKACWTCAARKIQCDRGLPTCKKCARARRDCRGYGLRLSWPRENDKKRVIVGKDAPTAVASQESIFFINTTWRDIVLYRHLSQRMRLDHLLPPSPNYLGHARIVENHMDLVQYFHHSAYLSLVTFGETTLQIRDALISMALAHDTPSGLALFHALLAFSSLHQHGFGEQAVQLKISALHFLSTSMGSGSLTSARAAQHVAASMLLGAFEILLPSEGSGEWLWHILGAADVIQATPFKDQPYETDTGRLLGWVYYHNALSRFSLHHWRHKPLLPNIPFENDSNPRNLPYQPLATYKPAPPSPNPTYAILNLLSEVCDTLLDPSDPRSQNKDYHDRLKTLERRIENVPVKSASARMTPEPPFAAELYQMATRIYLVRASQSPWEAPASLSSLIDVAFEGPIKWCTCEHFFPLFILACEAGRDDQRAAILNLIDRTQRDARIRSVEAVKNAVQSVWIQQDLHADSDVVPNYVNIMSAAISSSNTVPSFV